MDVPMLSFFKNLFGARTRTTCRLLSNNTGSTRGGFCYALSLRVFIYFILENIPPRSQHSSEVNSCVFYTCHMNAQAVAFGFILPTDLAMCAFQESGRIVCAQPCGSFLSAFK